MFAAARMSLHCHFGGHDVSTRTQSGGHTATAAVLRGALTLETLLHDYELERQLR